MLKRYLSKDSNGQTGDKEAIEVGEEIPLDWQDRGEELPAMIVMVMVMMMRRRKKRNTGTTLECRRLRRKCKALREQWKKPQCSAPPFFQQGAGGRLWDDDETEIRNCASILAFPDNGVDFNMMVYAFKVKSKIKDQKDREQFQNLPLSPDLQSKWQIRRHWRFSEHCTGSRR